MSLLTMSIQSGLIIAVVTIIRALAIDHLPKKTFVALWTVVLLRLVIPFSFSSPFSIYTLADRAAPATWETDPPVFYFPPTGTLPQNTIGTGTQEFPLMTLIWGTGTTLCALYFLFAYVMYRREFAASQPVDNIFTAEWLSRHRLRRTIRIHQSHIISAPLTYGILRPVILLPANTDWTDTGNLQYVLAHEYTHIRRFDAVTKILFTAALCIHWFNPLVWAMFFLANRDVELSCDETVIRSFGETTKSAYALTLISMEEHKRSLVPFSNSFSKNAIEERIKAIMKYKKTSIFVTLAALAIIVMVTIAFATSAAASRSPVTDLPNTDFTQSEYNKLLALRLDGYGKMNVSEYRDKVLPLIQTDEYRDLLERFRENIQLYDMRNTNNTASFLFYTLPLTADDWQYQEFFGYIQTPGTDFANPALLDYTLSINILDGKKLTVGNFEQARQNIIKELQEYYYSKSDKDLEDETGFNTDILNEIERLKKKWDSDQIQIEIMHYFTPITKLDQASMNEAKAELESSLAPYAAFGVTYVINEYDGQASLYWNGKQIRGIYDMSAGRWIANSAGTSAFEDDVRSLVAVYTNNELTGLRESTEQDLADWDIRGQE